MMLRMWQVLFVSGAIVQVIIAGITLRKAFPDVPEHVEKYPLALKALFGVSQRLQVFLDDDIDSNFIVSPLSATLVAAQLMLGTSGDFQYQIASLLLDDDVNKHYNYKLTNYTKNGNVTTDLPFGKLHMELSSLLTDLGNRNLRTYKLQQKSAIFFDQQLQLKGSFYDFLRRFYETDLYPMDFYNKPFNALSFINQWALKNTNGLIQSMLNEPPRPTTASIFANAIYFSAAWQTPFDSDMNRIAPFSITPTKQVTATYMINSFESILYAETNTYKLICLPYLNNELGMYILLPLHDTNYTYNIKSFVQSIEPVELFKTIDNAKRRGVVVKIPKMALSHSFSILETVKKFYAFRRKSNKKYNKIRDIKNKINSFENFTANPSDLNRDLFLTQALDKGHLRIDDIVQQVVLNVNENGTEAGVLTSSTVDYMGGQKNFLMDRPFVFFIQDEYTKATLFWGTITNPTV